MQSIANIFLKFLPSFFLFPVLCNVFFTATVGAKVEIKINVTLGRNHHSHTHHNQSQPQQGNSNDSPSIIEPPPPESILRDPNSIYPCNLAHTSIDEEVCMMILKWDIAARKVIAQGLPEIEQRSFTPKFAVNGQKTLAQANQLYACRSVECLCGYFKGGKWLDSEKVCQIESGQKVGKALRKEYRMMSEEERKEFHAALNEIHSPDSQEYLNLAAQHNPNQAIGSHGGPAFLPWHREYLQRYEFALRFAFPNVAIPYWDSSLDYNLEDPSDSIMWTKKMMGVMEDGKLVSDHWIEWKDAEDETVERNLKGSSSGLITDVDRIFGSSLQEIFAFSAAEDSCTQPKLVPNDDGMMEQIHGGVHIYVGGHMQDPVTAAFDPIFFMHHAFIDSLWEEWRHKTQTREEREHEYAAKFEQNCATAAHAFEADMRPFDGLKNKDGLSNIYNDELFEYAPRPNCTNDKGCGTDFLFCWRRDGLTDCVSKIKDNGNCIKFAENALPPWGVEFDESPCYNGVCINGKCEEHHSDESNSKPPMLQDEQKAIELSTPGNWSKWLRFNGCNDFHECCDVWNEAGKCKSPEDRRYMNIWCSASCGYGGCIKHVYPDPAGDCIDRKPVSCLRWLRTNPNECEQNPLWMAENCREKCGLCNVTREEKCRNKEPMHFMKVM